MKKGSVFMNVFVLRTPLRIQNRTNVDPKKYTVFHQISQSIPFGGKTNVKINAFNAGQLIVI